MGKYSKSKAKKKSANKTTVQEKKEKDVKEVVKEDKKEVDEKQKENTNNINNEESIELTEEEKAHLKEQKRKAQEHFKKLRQSITQSDPNAEKLMDKIAMFFGSIINQKDCDENVYRHAIEINQYLLSYLDYILQVSRERQSKDSSYKSYTLISLYNEKTKNKDTKLKFEYQYVQSFVIIMIDDFVEFYREDVDAEETTRLFCEKEEWKQVHEYSKELCNSYLINKNMFMKHIESVDNEFYAYPSYRMEKFDLASEKMKDFAYLRPILIGLALLGFESVFKYYKIENYIDPKRRFRAVAKKILSASLYDLSKVVDEMDYGEYEDQMKSLFDMDTTKKDAQKQDKK